MQQDGELIKCEEVEHPLYPKKNKMRLKRTTAFVFLILGLLVQTSFAAAAKEKCFTINSPNGKIKLTV